MTQLLQFVCPERFDSRKDDRLICYRCDCNTGYCFKVMRDKTVQKASKKSRFHCPAHGESQRSSTHVAAFADILQAMDCNLRVVWDWACVPANHRMSIDATVLCGVGGVHVWCSSFEIDGAGHFQQSLTDRAQRDKDKDKLLNASNEPVMRLHFRDQHVWNRYIKMHISQLHSGISYTESYIHCLRGEKESEMILASRDL